MIILRILLCLGSAAVLNAATVPSVHNQVNLPFSFEANYGQIHPRVMFLARGAGYVLYLSSTEAVLGLRGDVPSVLRVQYVGASPDGTLSGVDEPSGKAHYFKGRDPSGWRANIPTYTKVRHSGLYPGVDLVYYRNQGQLEYDFVVHPGGNPEAIRLRYSGADQIEPDAEGNLTLRTAGGEVLLRAPHIFQESDGVRQSVSGGYVLHDTREIGFRIGAYNVSKPLLIDPVLSYSTYFGGSASDQARAVAADDSGAVYVGGNTLSLDLPTTLAAFDRDCGSDVKPCKSFPRDVFNLRDAFIAKLSPDGTSLIYSTYLGGTDTEALTDLVIDQEGDVYATGWTRSNDFPTTTEAFQRTFGSGLCGGPDLGPDEWVPCADAFVVKLSPDGSTLVYATFLGGVGYEDAWGIAVDGAGHAFVAGRGYTLPTTPGAFQPLPRPGVPQCGNNGIEPCNRDAFVAKLNPSGSALVYSTFLGGSHLDTAQGIALDATGHAYVTGWTASTDFPMVNALQTAPGGGGSDAFVSKLSPDGSALVYSTYLGGTASENLEFDGRIAVDVTGSAYVTGSTDSSDFPTTPTAFQSFKWSSGSDVFVTKLNSAGSGIVYSTFLGGDGSNQGRDIAVDPSGNAYVTGRTNSDDLPAWRELPRRGNDAFLLKLNAAGSCAIFFAYLGGSVWDGGHAVAVDSARNVYLTGQTNSLDFTTTEDAFQTSPPSPLGVGDGFVAKFSGLALPCVVESGDENFGEFGTVVAGSTSEPHTIILTNAGDGPLIITTAVVTGDFAQTNTCANLPPGGTCTVSATFTPTATGERTGAITFVTSLATSPDVVPLRGTGADAIAIDIKPCTYPNAVNLGTAGVIPVAILGSANFQVSTILPASVTLQGLGAKTVGKTESPLCHIDDVAGPNQTCGPDGHKDLVCQMQMDTSALTPGDSLWKLDARTNGGSVPLAGYDTVRIVP